MSDGQKNDVTLEEFSQWSSEQVCTLAKGKTVVLATGGSSRWYLFEHGDMRVGYSEREQFRDYGEKAGRRIVEIASMMMNDGVQTVFAPGFAGGQGERDSKYVDNLKWGYSVLADEYARQMYAELGVGVLFRGKWANLFGRLGAIDLLESFAGCERETTAKSDRWLVWYVEDDYIPESLTGFCRDYIEAHGAMPSKTLLTEQYYGRPLSRVDILVGNNKPGVGGLAPALLELSELYFTVSPTPYMDHTQWRHILYDHLFARRTHYREYGKISPDAVEEMRRFYQAHLGETLGVGVYSPEMQIWQPEPWASEKSRDR